MLLGKLKPFLTVGAVAACTGLAAGTASGAVLTVVGGQLTGAQNVEIDGALYDVAFLDGTCENVFNGCDAASDFTFTTVQAAFDAAQALIDQVFLDGPEGLFDSDADATVGCSGYSFCGATIPYDTAGEAPYTVQRAAAVNHDNELYDTPNTYAGGIIPTWDTGGFPYSVWAVFEQVSEGDEVPAPGMAWLLGLGLAGMAVARRKRNGRA